MVMAHDPMPPVVLDIVLYSDLTDTAPQHRRPTWQELADGLSEHEIRTEKDGPGWSATVYQKNATRGKRGVKVVTALVLDVDHEEPLWSLIDGLEYVAHTTWKHHAGDAHEGCRGRRDCPHWRIIIPLLEPVKASEWDEFRERARFWLCPNADESAKDAPRFFWLPTAQPDTPYDTRRGRGRWLNPDELRAVPSEDAAARVAPGTSVRDANDTGERPGDRFEREADWCRDILPDWKPVGHSGDNLLMHRPGSTNRFGATISQRGQGVLYVFTDAAHPLKPNTCYSKFGAYATLEHGGDFKAAAVALAARYGMAKPKGESIGRIGMAKANDDEEVVESADEYSAPGRRPLTETGNAERLVDQYGDRIRFCHPWGAWLHWDGRRWRRDQTGTVRNWAKNVTRSIFEEIGKAETKEERQKIWKWANTSEKAAARAAMLKLAESEPGIPIEPEEMDRQPFLLNVMNGTVNLQTGMLRSHNQTDVLTKLAPVYFDADAECPTFLAFLERVLPDPDVRAFLQRMTGYGMTGVTSEQCLAFFYGSGANGKSTFLSIMQEMLGDYAQEAAPDLLTSRGGDRHPTELADLFGARWVSSIEVDEGKRLAETLVKQMTGGDKIKARFMRTDFFQWTPTHKLFLAANHKPEIRGTDYAIWRRIHIVPFTVTIPPEERDGKLVSKLLAELPGILNWAIAGCLAWQREGLGVPQAVRSATEEYRQEQDVLAVFLEEHCVIERDASAPTTALYKAYTAWAETGGVKPISSQAFGRRLTERGMEPGRGRDGKRTWIGLRLAGAEAF